MKKAALILGMAIVLVCSVALALAADETKSPAQKCKEWGWAGTPAFDGCVSCTAQGGGGGTSDTAECICKTLMYLSPDAFDAQFRNLGQCVKYVNSMRHQ